MRQIFCWVAANAETIIAISTVLYFAATAAILWQTVRSANAAKRSADAAEKAATAARNNVDAAKKSAEAAEKSADAAKDTASLMRGQIEEQAIRNKMAAQAGVNATLTNISVWALKAVSVALKA